MTRVCALVRGEATRADLVRVLDELGIAAGEHFLICHPDVLDAPQAVLAGDSLAYAVPGVAEDALGPFNTEMSRKAAIANFPRSGTQRFRVLDLLCREHPRCRDRIAQALSLPDSGTDARVMELIAGGWAMELDETETTRHGGEAKKVTATDRGRDEWRAHAATQ